MQSLLAGYQRFRAQAWPDRRRAFESLAHHGQKPQALVISCIDSRVDPAVIFDAAPGEILTVRNVANLVPPYAPDAAYHGTSAALEFGVRVLEVRHLIVLGHGSCGGVRTLVEGAPAEALEFVAPWMSLAAPALEKALRRVTPEERQFCCEHEVIKVSLANLMTFPWIASRVAEGRLMLHGAWFAIHTGILMMLQPDGSFTSADQLGE
jgi:carbonic anhydrase